MELQRYKDTVRCGASKSSSQEMWKINSLNLCICKKTHTFLHWSSIVKSQRSRIELVTRPLEFFRTTSNTQTFTFPPLPLDGTSKPVAENTVFAEAHYFLSKGITSIHLYYYLKKMNAEDGYTDWKQFQSFLGKSALKSTLKTFLFEKWKCRKKCEFKSAIKNQQLKKATF